MGKNEHVAQRLRLGVDVGGTKTQAVLLDDADEVISTARVLTRRGAEGVAATVLEVVAALGHPLDALFSVGVGVPGLIDTDTGVVRSAVNLDLKDCPLAETLTAMFGVPVRVENDAKATALGAVRLMPEAAGSLAYLNFGTGTSLAFVVDGRLVRGHLNASGEIGHIVIDPEGEMCACGQRGCLETVIGGRNLRARLERLGLDLRTLAVDDATSVAQSEYARLVGGIVTAISIAGLLLDPKVIVIGGGVITACPAIVTAVRTRLMAAETGSSFLGVMTLSSRMITLPDDVPVQAMGAAGL
jgi:predicted NBD/HSP70 family sugar kinase